jgi:DNA-binding transcriptional LysR family regulator
MLPLMERCFDSALTAKALARSISSEDVAPLPLALSNSVNVELVMPAIAEVFRTLPGLQLRLLHGDGHEVLELLKRGDAAIAVAGPMTGGWERLDQWTLFDEPFELAVRDDHPLAKENEVTVEKLKAYPLFVQRGCEMHDAAMRMFEARGISMINLHEVATLHDLGAMIANGLGAAVLPRSAPRLENSKRMPIDGLPLTRAVSVYAVSGRPRDTAAAAFLNLLRSSEFAAA